MKRLDEITIADLMPDSISGDAQVSATARAIDPQLRLISEAVDRPLILASIDELSAGVLEHLAVQYDVTAWDSAWPIETKRAVLKTAIADKRKMGTRGAVQRAIEAVAPIATITEWWQDTSGDMSPHTFKIDLLQEESAVDAETQANVIAQVNEAKPVRSHYTFTAIQEAGSGFYFAGVLRAIAYARVRSAGITIERTSIQAGICAALRGMNIRRLLASSHMGEMPEPVVPDVPLFGGDFSGNKITMESVDGGGSLIDKYAHYKALFELRGWSPGGDFTAYQPLGGILTGTSDNAIWVKAGSMGGVIDEYVLPTPVVTSVEVNLGLRWDVSGGTNTWLAKTFAANDWWWSGILSQSDVDTIESVGGSICPTTNPSEAWPGLIGALKFEPYHFTYELLKMYSGLGVDEVSFDPSNFSLIGYESPTSDALAYRSCMLIRATNAFDTLTKSYRVRITNKYPNDRDSIFVMLGLKYDYSLLEWKSVMFSGSGSYWWAGILNAVDQAKLQALGLVSDTEYPFDEVLYSDAYEYECLGVYYNLWGDPIYGGENFHVEKAQDYQVITLVSNAATGEYTKYWLCKIIPKVPNSDYVKGTISGLTLPTAHSGQYSSVLFNSLRYYAKGTLSNTGSITASDTPCFGVYGPTWYYGTITWTDESLGDLSDKIAISSVETGPIIVQSVFRIIFIQGSAITGYHPKESGEESYNAITGYSYNNGTHTITFYATSGDWTASQYAGRIQLRYLDGVSTFKKLSAFDLVDVSNGTLSKATTTDRYDMYNTWNGDITVIAKYNT